MDPNQTLQSQFVNTMFVSIMAPCAAGLIVGLLLRPLLAFAKSAVFVTVIGVALLTVGGLATLDWERTSIVIPHTKEIVFQSFESSRLFLLGHPVTASCVVVGLAAGILLRECWTRRAHVA